VSGMDELTIVRLLMAAVVIAAALLLWLLRE
jgi:hypothetical protein